MIIRDSLKLLGEWEMSRFLRDGLIFVLVNFLTILISMLITFLAKDSPYYLDQSRTMISMVSGSMVFLVNLAFYIYFYPHESKKCQVEDRGVTE